MESASKLSRHRSRKKGMRMVWWGRSRGGICRNVLVMVLLMMVLGLGVFGVEQEEDQQKETEEPKQGFTDQLLHAMTSATSGANLQDALSSIFNAERRRQEKEDEAKQAKERASKIAAAKLAAEEARFLPLKKSTRRSLFERSAVQMYPNVRFVSINTRVDPTLSPSSASFLPTSPPAYSNHNAPNPTTTTPTSTPTQHSHQTQVQDQHQTLCSYFNPFIPEQVVTDEAPFNHWSFWTYRLCHGHRVQQIHLQPTKLTLRTDPPTDALQGIFVPPSPSLLQKDPTNQGLLLVPTIIHDLGTYKPANPQITTNYFTNGRAIYDNGADCTISSSHNQPVIKKRTTKVFLQNYPGAWAGAGPTTSHCCHRPAGPQHLHSIFPAPANVRILHVHEPSQCTYFITVCMECATPTTQQNQPPASQTNFSQSSHDSNIWNPLFAQAHPLAGLASLAGANLPPLPIPSSPTSLFKQRILHNQLHAQSFPPLPPSRIRSNLELLRAMFTRSYDAYMYHAYPQGEIRPLTCRPGTFSPVRIPALTLIDSLDTLLVMGNGTEFARACERLRLLDRKMRINQNKKNGHHTTTTTTTTANNNIRQRSTLTMPWNTKKDEDQSSKNKAGMNDETQRVSEGGLFAIDQNVSLFETNIRILGGLLSAHQMALAYVNHDVMEGKEESAAEKHTTVWLNDVFDHLGKVRKGVPPSVLEPTTKKSSISKIKSKHSPPTAATTHDILPDSVENTMLTNGHSCAFEVDVIHRRENVRFSGANGDILSSPSLSPLLSLAPQTPQTYSGPANSAPMSCPATAKPDDIDDFGPCSFGGRDFIEDKNNNTSTTSKQAAAMRSNTAADFIDNDGNNDLPLYLWHYDGFLLDLAHDLGLRLLKAFDTATGIPYGTVNLLHGVPRGETTVASLAGGGTLTLEFELLSRLTGDPAFGRAAKLASRALWFRRSRSLNLVGKHIDIHTGKWRETLSGVGSNSDSFYEYLIKHYILFPDDVDFMPMFMSVYGGVHRESKAGDWYADVDMNGGMGRGQRNVFESLMAFYPGMQVLLGELDPAARTLNAFFIVRELLGFLPERFHFSKWEVEDGGGLHPLRPELLESAYFMHRATSGIGHSQNEMSVKSTGWQWAADFAIRAISNITNATCGHATISSVSPLIGSLAEDILVSLSPEEWREKQRQSIRLKDDMPSFFLTETLKYLYLTLDDDNILHQDTEREWIFTTEAHPIHHVSYSNFEEGHSEDHVDEQTTTARDRILSTLQQRLSQTTANDDIQTEKENAASEIDPSPYGLTDEKWTERTKLADFQKDIENEENQALRYKVNLAYSRAKSNKSNGVHIARRGRLQSLLTTRESPVQSDTHSASFLGPYGEELQRDGNFAYFVFDPSGRGEGFGLSQSCPHRNHPDLTWVRAMHGGSTDYVEYFVPSISSEDVEEEEEEEEEGDSLAADERPFTALAAVGFYGTGHVPGLGNPFDRKSDFCHGKNPGDDDDIFLGQQQEQLKNDGGTTKDNDSKGEKNKHSNDKSSRYRRLQTFDMGKPLGSFDVAIFEEGMGFYVRHVDSGEEIEMTVFPRSREDERNPTVNHKEESAGDSGDVVLVSAMMPSRLKKTKKKLTPSPTQAASQSKGGSKRKSITPILWSASMIMSGESLNLAANREMANSKDKSDGHGNGKDTESIEDLFPKHRVVISDLHGHPFRCDIRIKLRRTSDSQSQSDGNKRETYFNDDIATFPCTPGMYGPSTIAALIETHGLSVEAPIFAPFPSNSDGCEKGGPLQLFDLEKNDPGKGVDEHIQSVHRGGCTFEEKAHNLKNRQNSSAIIVINSDSDQLFIMAGNGGRLNDSTETKDKDNLTPLSVLVTKDDGEELLQLVNIFSKKQPVIAEIRIDPQFLRNSDKQDREDPNENMEFPVVRTSPDAIQVFAPHGWGFHAVQSGVDNNVHKQEQKGNDGSTAQQSEWQMYILQHDYQ